MWHAQGKPSISSFLEKFLMHDLEKTPLGSWGKTWQSFEDWPLGERRNFESFSDWIARCLDLTRDPSLKADRRLGEVSGGLPRLQWWLNDEIWAISSGCSRRTYVKFFLTSSRISSGVFSKSCITKFLRKTWNRRFSSPVSHLVFIVLWIE